jgi:hypothetical protein
MAKKSRARRGVGKSSIRQSSRSKSSGRSSNVRQSLHDAQAVFARYFESGGKRVKETFDALAEIFQSKHLGDALRVAPVRTGRATRSAPRARTATGARKAQGAPTRKARK